MANAPPVGLHATSERWTRPTLMLVQDTDNPMAAGKDAVSGHAPVLPVNTDITPAINAKNIAFAQECNRLSQSQQYRASQKSSEPSLTASNFYNLDRNAELEVKFAGVFEQLGFLSDRVGFLEQENVNLKTKVATLRAQDLDIGLWILIIVG